MNIKHRMILLAAAGAVVFLMLAAVSIHLVLRYTDWPGRWVQAQINAKLAGQVRMAHLNASLFDLRMEVLDLQVLSPDGRRLMGCDRITVDLSWRRLLTGVIGLEDGRVDGLTVDLRLDERGQPDLLAVLPARNRQTEKTNGAVPAVWPVVIERLALAGAHFRLVDPFQHFSLATGPLRLEIAGDSRGPAADVALAVGSVDLAFGSDAWQLSGMDVKARLENGVLSLKRFLLAAFGATLSATGQADLSAWLSDLPGGSGALDRITYQIDAQLSRLPLASVLPAVWELGGQLAGRLSISGQGIDPNRLKAQGKLALSVVKFSAPEMTNKQDIQLQAGATLDGEQLTLSECRITAGNLLLSGQVRLLRDSRALSGRFAATAADMAPLLAVFDLGPATGRLKATATVAGTLRQPRIDLTGRAGDLMLAGTMLGNVDLAARLTSDGWLDLSHLTLVNRTGQISAGGRLRLWAPDDQPPQPLSLSLTATLVDVDPVAFRPALALHGRISGELTADGTLERPQVKVTLDGRQMRFENVAVDRVQVSGRFSDGRLHAERIRIDRGASSLSASGRLDLVDKTSNRGLADPPLAVHISGADLHLEDVLAGYAGRLSVSADLAGTLSHPTANWQISGRGLQRGQIRLPGVQISGGLVDRRLSVARLDIDLKDKQQLTGSGWININQRFAFQLAGSDLALNRFAGLEALAPISGRVSLKASGQGSIASPQVSGTLVVTDFGYHDLPLADSRLQFDLHGSRLRLQGRGNLEFDADCDLADNRFHVAAVMRRTQLAPYFAAAGQQQLNGTVSGRLNATGRLNHWQETRGQLDLAHLVLFADQTPLVAGDAIHLVFDDRKLAMKPVRLALLTDGWVDVSGRGDIGGQMDIGLKGYIPLAAAANLHPDLAGLAGDLGVELQLSGDMTHPVYRAELKLHNATMAPADWGQQIGPVSGRVDIDAGQVRIKKVHGRLGRGDFHIEGTLGHDGVRLTDADLSLTAAGATINVPDTLDVRFDADLRVTGRKGRLRADGDLVLIEGLYYRDVQMRLADQVMGPRRAIAPRSDDLHLPIIGEMTLDIGLRHRQAMRVDNNVADLYVAPHLRLGGTVNRPVLKGRIEVTEGTLTYQRKQFEVTRGVVDFLNPRRTEATLDVAGRTTVRQWTIVLAVKGKLDDLVVDLTSDPAREPADLVSLLLFGRTTEELADGQGGGKSSALVLGEWMAGRYGDDLRRTTGLDILELTDTSTADDTVGTSVTVGKRLSRRLTVKYGVDISDREVVQKGISEYKLLESILINGFQESTGNFGGELVIRMVFR